jgi:hypothetical protein
MAESKIRLYLKSVKTVTGTVEVEREYIPRPRLPPTVRTQPKHEYILPEDQQKATEMVKSIAYKYGLKVEVVDVTRENVFRREMQKEREKIRIFPTLIVSSGERIEGNITEQQVEELLSNKRSSDTHQRGKRTMGLG